MLYEAFHWNPERPRSRLRDFLEDPGFRLLLNEWGSRDGDRAVVAETDSDLVGAAWYRYWCEERHSYGFVHSRYPELGIAVRQKYRANGVGRRLLPSLIAAARQESAPGLSLSVESQNFAIALYRSEGFEEAGASGTSLTLLLEFGRRHEQPNP